MKVEAHVVTVKLIIENPELDALGTANAIEDAMIGEFGKRMWKIGTYADQRVTKVKEIKRVRHEAK